MGKSGYAHLVKHLASAVRPPPTRLNVRARKVALARFVAKACCPELGRRSYEQYPNKPWGEVLGLHQDQDPSAGTTVSDAAVPTVDSLVQRVKSATKLLAYNRYSLEIMILETQLYLSLTHSFENAIKEKFEPATIRHRYRAWVRADPIDSPRIRC